MTTHKMLVLGAALALSPGAGGAARADYMSTLLVAPSPNPFAGVVSTTGANELLVAMTLAAGQHPNAFQNPVRNVLYLWVAEWLWRIGHPRHAGTNPSAGGILAVVKPGSGSGHVAGSPDPPGGGGGTQAASAPEPGGLALACLGALGVLLRARPRPRLGGAGRAGPAHVPN